MRSLKAMPYPEQIKKVVSLLTEQNPNASYADVAASLKQDPWGYTVTVTCGDSVLYYADGADLGEVLCVS